MSAALITTFWTIPNTMFTSQVALQRTRWKPQKCQCQKRMDLIEPRSYQLYWTWRAVWITVETPETNKQAAGPISETVQGGRHNYRRLIRSARGNREQRGPHGQHYLSMRHSASPRLNSRAPPPLSQRFPRGPHLCGTPCLPPPAAPGQDPHVACPGDRFVDGPPGYRRLRVLSS